MIWRMSEECEADDVFITAYVLAIAWIGSIPHAIALCGFGIFLSLSVSLHSRSECITSDEILTRSQPLNSLRQCPS